MKSGPHMERVSDSAARTVAGRFADTPWSAVLAAGRGNPEAKARALERLCHTYWYPIYASIRWRGRSPHDAEDLTQGYFARLLHRDAFQHVTPGKTKFRSYLLVALNHYLADEHARESALKRGGGRPLISFDAHQAEDRYQLEPVEAATPEKYFERRWALTLLDTALARLEAEYRDRGRAPLFRELNAFKGDGVNGGRYRDAATRAGLSEEAFKKAVQRLRQRYQELIREEIARTVASPTEIDAEVRHLIAVLSD